MDIYILNQLSLKSNPTFITTSCVPYNYKVIVTHLRANVNFIDGCYPYLSELLLFSTVNLYINYNSQSSVADN